MQLTAKQELGLNMVVDMYNNGKRRAVIAGYAGCGKSTLAAALVGVFKAEFGIQDDEIRYCAFTGKAAQVLKSKGCPGATTLHKLLYSTRLLDDGRYARRAKRPAELADVKLVIVDECSMLPQSMLDLINQHRFFTIYLGDPGQLPVINPKEKTDLLDNPDIFLDEIMRQEADNDIIQLSMLLREQKPLELYDGKNVKVLNKSDLTIGLLNWGDIVCCSTNDTRRFLNEKIRNSRGLSGDFEIGKPERLICLKNYDNGYVNGTTGDFTPRFHDTLKSRRFGVEVPYVDGYFCPDGDEDPAEIKIDRDVLLGKESSVPLQTLARISHSKKPIALPMYFTYGYALTAWKAQGSQWDNVVIIEEKFPFDKDVHYQALYTALTRAAKKAVIIKAQ